MKEKNANPRPVGEPATKEMKKRLGSIIDDPSVYRTSRAEHASAHLHHLVDVALARGHKSRAFLVFLERLPPLAAKAAEEAAVGLDLRRYECLPPISGDDAAPSLCF